MQNKANFSKPKMVVTLVITMTNNNERRTTNYSKQTQTNPILSADLSGVAHLSVVATTKTEAKSEALAKAGRVTNHISPITPSSLFSSNFARTSSFLSTFCVVFSRYTIKYLSLRPQTRPLLFSTKISAVSPINCCR